MATELFYFLLGGFKLAEFWSLIDEVRLSPGFLTPERSGLFQEVQVFDGLTLTKPKKQNNH